jgi:N-acetylmuramic acid 6-phosphate etherase
MKKTSSHKPLTTEARNPRTMQLDLLSTQNLVALINQEDQQVAVAVRHGLPQIARSVDVIVDRMRRGGRLIYVGAGTSGRIGVLDAVESIPTFGTSPSQIQGLIAGGYETCYRAAEASEDDAAAGARALLKKKISRRDVVVGIAATGRTPYTCGALRRAKSAGAATIAIVNNRNSEMERIADLTIEVLTGPEVLTGSTRMKAGTAQKMICNILSTAAMVRLGAVYSNLMINVHMKSRKLIGRGVTILQEISGAQEGEAREALAASKNDLRVAAVMLVRKCDRKSALAVLNQARGNLRRALGATKKGGRKSAV